MTLSLPKISASQLSDIRICIDMQLTQNIDIFHNTPKQSHGFY